MSGTSPPAEQLPVELPTCTDIREPNPRLTALREERPLGRLRYPDGSVGWLVTSHALAKAVLMDPRFGAVPFGEASPVGDPSKEARRAAVVAETGMLAAALGLVDPPLHKRYRRLLAGHFTAARVTEHESQIARIVTARLDAMEQAGPPLDLLKAFATPVVVGTHCVLLGIPESEGERLARFDASVVTSDADELRTAYRDFCDFLRPLLEQKRREPADDLMSHIVAQGELSDDEIFSTILFLCIAGLGTTDGMLALAALALLANPEQLERMRSDPASIEPTVEELLRYVTNFSVAGPRRALEDVELGGIAIEAGETVTISLTAANHDPDKFADPDALDLERTARGHLAFGHGIHVCLGQHLARLELRVALVELVKRFPTLRLAIPVEEVPMYDGDHGTELGVHELPVAW